MTNMKRSPTPSPKVAAKFNSGQSEAELYGLFINFTTSFRTSDHADKALDHNMLVCQHAFKHWMFSNISAQATKIYKTLSEETGLVLSQHLRNIFEVPLQCCSGKQEDQETAAAAAADVEPK
ncbi:hypothetical protein IWX49DRAFT_593574 [Phyllosticta citricarpa]